MFKKIGLYLGGAALIVILVLILRGINQSKSPVALVSKEDITEIDNASLTRLEGHGMTKLLENQRMALSVDFDTGNIEVLNKANGYLWRSCPTAEELALENANELWSQNMTSPVMFTYVNELASMNVKLGNVYNQNTDISVYQLENGIRVNFDFTLSGIHIAYDLALTDLGFTVDIPPYLVKDTGEVYMTNALGAEIVNVKATFCMTDYSVFPFLGATRSDTGLTGYLLLPDGPGALVRFENNKGVKTQFVGAVYGTDFAYLPDYNDEYYSQYSKATVNYPVFGIVRGDNGLMCIIEKGETQAEIIGSPAYAQTGFNTAYPRLTNRKSYKVLTNATTGDGYFKFTDFTQYESRRLHYVLSEGEDASYIGMAKQYRDILAEQYHLTRISETGAPPMTITFIGGDVEPSTIGDRFVTMTRFDQAQEMLRYFKEQGGIQSLRILWSGWEKRGLGVRSPDKLPAAAALGGDKGLKEFTRYAQSLGSEVLLLDTNVDTYQSKKGITIRKDTVYNIQGFALFGGRFLNAAATRRLFDKNLKTFQDYGVDGIAETGIGQYITSDFNPGQRILRNESVTEQQAFIQYLREQLDTVMIMNPRAYTLSDGVIYGGMTTESTYLTVLDEAVPFYPIALHGNIAYYSGTYDWLAEPDLEMLRCLEYGGMVDFTLTYAPTEAGRNCENFFYYSTSFETRRDEYIAIYQRFSEVYAALRGQYIVGHERQGNLTRVQYERGDTLLINYGTSPETVDGVTIGARDFVLLREEAPGNAH